MRMGFLPEPFGDFQRIDLEVLPPRGFVACLVKLAVVGSTERNGEFVADLEPQGSRLGKA